ncbi:MULTISPECIES: periplasmic heavy metal sensor [Roseomonadaceae]|uniref:Periplasmic heavy metal sensor n=1 Tax=Falsiroseomonas oleicola TaxID=2801474 RepID=A0ABS6HDZ8_9PROT|nr:periplasmic heavy metal sensor [Roseomonas oleicola]MBU8546950.1 periplasmic heavy metal sensor [Roseomonas oleicola]
MTGLTRLRLVLLASLGLNLFAGAYFAAQAWRGALPLETAGLALELGDRPLLRLMQALPEADADRLRQAFAPRRGQVMAQFMAQRDALAAVRRELTRDQPDPGALGRAIETVQQGRAALAQSLAALLMEAAPGMSPEGRRVLAEFRLAR